MIESILNFFRGCQHRHYTFPRSDRHTGRCYVACTACGAQFEYSWSEMRRLGPVDAPETLVQCPVEAARRAT